MLLLATLRLLLFYLLSILKILAVTLTRISYRPTEPSRASNMRLTPISISYSTPTPAIMSIQRLPHLHHRWDYQTLIPCFEFWYPLNHLIFVPAHPFPTMLLPLRYAASRTQLTRRSKKTRVVVHRLGYRHLQAWPHSTVAFLCEVRKRLLGNGKWTIYSPTRIVMSLQPYRVLFGVYLPSHSGCI